MDDLKERIIEFKDNLQRAYDAQQNKTDKYSRGVAAVTRTLLRDYDRIFNPSILKQPVSDLRPLAEKFCHQDGCPICGAKMVARNGRSGTFLGCTRYPACHGCRHADGTISINDALRLFLTGKVREETLRQEQEERSRFRNLDIDDH